MEPEGRRENQRETRLLANVIRAPRFCEPINSLFSVETFTCNIESFVIVTGSLKEYHIQ